MAAVVGIVVYFALEFDMPRFSWMQRVERSGLVDGFRNVKERMFDGLVGGLRFSIHI